MESKFVIQTRHGNQFDPKTSKISHIDINDIAHALSNICRYTGHTRRFYSVAEHSVLTYRLAAFHWPNDLEVQWACLLHDATEAYIGDISTPLKQLLPNFNEIEKILAESIADEFNIKTTRDIQRKVKQVDKEALATEAKVLFSKVDDWKALEGVNTYNHLLPLGFPNTPEESRDSFLEVFKSLLRKLRAK